MSSTAARMNPAVTVALYRDHAVIVIDLVAAGLDRIPARRKGPM